MIAQPKRPRTTVALPTEVKTGGRNYYKERLADFQRRNPGVAPPDYYLNYGDKYCAKFSSLTENDLSASGLQWRDRTLLNLQNAIEQKRAEDPVRFAHLERDPQAFKDFCYGTHPDAYIQGGLFELPASDLLMIAATPELSDLIGKEGLAQVAEVMSRLELQNIQAIGEATAQQGLRTGATLLQNVGKQLEEAPLSFVAR